MKLLFVRHGETDWNVVGRLLGQTDQELSANGVAEAYDTAKHFPTQVEAIFTSPLKRSFETAEILNQKLQVPLIAKDELKEKDFGTLTGKTWKEIEAEYGPEVRVKNRNQTYDYRNFGGESAEQVQSRMGRFFTELHGQQYNIVAVVCHSGIIRMVYHMLSNQYNVPVNNASVHEFNI